MDSSNLGALGQSVSDNSILGRWVILTAYSITIHNASWDYSGREPRHGTRVTSLAEKPYFEASAPSRREALGLLGEEEKKELEASKGN